MHELALMDDLVQMISDELPEAEIQVVRLELGAAACVSAEALNFCFDVCTRGTRLEGAKLEIARAKGNSLSLKEVEVA